MTDFYVPRRAVFIYAHPDDIEFSVAGTAARWARAGSEITYVVITDGNVGTHDLETTAARIAEIRRQEQEAAARVAGWRAASSLPRRPLSRRCAAQELVAVIRRYGRTRSSAATPRISAMRINHPTTAAATAALTHLPAAEMHLFIRAGSRWPAAAEPRLASNRARPAITWTSQTIDVKTRRCAARASYWDPKSRLRRGCQREGGLIRRRLPPATLKEDEGEE